MNPQFCTTPLFCNEKGTIDCQRGERCFQNKVKLNARWQTIDSLKKVDGGLFIYKKSPKQQIPPLCIPQLFLYHSVAGYLPRGKCVSFVFNMNKIFN